MPQITLSDSAATDAGIAANAARSLIMMQGTAGFRFSLGATFVADDSQLVQPRQPVVLEGTLAQLAISFGPAVGCIIEATYNP